MRHILLLCALGCSVDHLGLGPSTSSTDASVDQTSPLFDSGAGVDVGFDAGFDADSPVSCADGLRNGNESDIDCGGDCGVCAAGATCRVGSDCNTQYCDVAEMRCRMPESCVDLRRADNFLETGAYKIDPDGTGPGESLMVWCDMSFDGGGWTLVVASNAAGPETGTEGGVMPETNSYLSRANLEPLAFGASQVHIRTQDMVDRSVTSEADSTPIQNLREFKMLEIAHGGPSSSWTGPMKEHLDYHCTPMSLTYPNLFHACNNQEGLHWYGDLSRWEYGESNEALELYVR